MARVLITGGAGFIGKALAARLRSDGNEVHVMDLGPKIAAAGDSLRDCEQHVADVSSPESFAPLRRLNVDCAFHLASQTSARLSEEQPMWDIDVNVKGALNFCAWARESKPRRVVYTSSMAVYGASGDGLREQDELSPVAVYGISKCAGEHFFRLLRDEGVGAHVYRLFNVYGPGQDYFNSAQGMLSIYLAQALTSDVIEVTGSLSRYRDFVYVDDVVDALLLEPDSDDFVFNVGNGVPVRVRDLLDMILQVTAEVRPGVTVKQVESHRGDVFGNFADTTLLRSNGWSAKVGLATGLTKTLADAREVLL